MIVLRNARIIPELTENYNDTAADIVLDAGIIQEILPPRTAHGENMLERQSLRD